MKIFLVVFLLFSGLAHANEIIDPTLRKNELNEALTQLKSKNQFFIGQIESQKGYKPKTLSPKQREIFKQYKELKKLLDFWGPASGLKEALVARYQQAMGENEFNQQLSNEASYLSFELIQEIHRLQKKYKINSFPVIHNFLIMLHYKKRGSCKHWAEDLLKKTEHLKRHYFTAYWGEAFPGKAVEHNVAVLVPRGKPFSEGLMIDPWRTGGKPFWLHVTQDHFYKWNDWPAYTPR